jgi:hypothetical protein
MPVLFRVQKCGPGLVSVLRYKTVFMVHEDLDTEDKLRFAGKPDDDQIGLHSMVLIEVRETGSKKRFLLQN